MVSPASAAQIRHSNSALEWNVEVAPEPRDVYWANLPMDDRVCMHRKNLRLLKGHLCVAAV